METSNYALSMFVLLTQTVHCFNSHFFPGEPGLANCTLLFLLHLFPDCASFHDITEFFISSLTQSHQVFTQMIPLSCSTVQSCLVSSTSTVIQLWHHPYIQHPNNINLPFLIYKLTCSSLNDSPISALLLIPFNLKPQLASVLLPY